MEKTTVNKENYIKLNEGLGGAYERIAYSNIIARIARQLNAKTILELNATYIAGIPGFNSCLLAQKGEFDIYITVHSRDIEDAHHVWELTGLKNKVTIYKHDNDIKTPFAPERFDLVWNHLAFEHHKDPQPLIKEMKRLAKLGIITLTLSPFNLGFTTHWLTHKLSGKPYDHGYFKNTLISTMQKAHKKEGLVEIENGACDVPPWLDTVDAQMGGSMTYTDNYPTFMRNNWIWTSIDPECQTHWLTSLLWSWEAAMPSWFKKAVGHHLYVASRK